jgi:hypothetical protein
VQGFWDLLSGDLRVVKSELQHSRGGIGDDMDFVCGEIWVRELDPGIGWLSSGSRL